MRNIWGASGQLYLGQIRSYLLTAVLTTTALVIASCVKQEAASDAASDAAAVSADAATIDVTATDAAVTDVAATDAVTTDAVTTDAAATDLAPRDGIANYARESADIAAVVTSPTYDEYRPGAFFMHAYTDPVSYQNPPLGLVEQPLGFVEQVQLGWDADVSPESECFPSCAPFISITRGKTYNLNLSVVAEAVEARISSILDVAVKATPKGESLKVNLVPIFASGVSPSSNTAYHTSYPLSLKRPVLSPSTEPAQKWGSTKIPFVVNSFARGCAQIVVSVWNEEMTIALDSLLVTVPVDGFIGQTSCRDPANGNLRLQKTMVQSMADVVDIFADPRSMESKSNRVGIHVFEVGASRGDSYAVVVIHTGSTEAQVSGWRLVSTITESFRTDQEFQNRVTLDRKQLSQTESGRWAYQKTAEFIKKKLFTAESPSQVPGMSAEQTFDAIKAAIESDPKTRVSAQFFVPGGADGNERMYLPLRMLAAPNSKLIAGDFVLIEPISASNTNNSSTCISKWNVLTGPSILKNLEEPHRLIANRITALHEKSWRAPTIASHDGVKAFFNPAAGSSAAPTSPEGIVLLAHYGAGGIEIESDIEKIDMEDIKRSFAPGSVAFLAACGTAAPNASNGLIHNLHQRNIDSFVASPLSVPADYALVLTEHLLKAIDSSYENHKTPTLQELYAEAVEATSLHYKNTNGFIGDGHQHLEYVLIGDPTIRLCNLPPTEVKDNENDP
ncbi:MAG: hypothetical protein ACREO1_10705 [Arenimonas sp.]